MSLQSAVSTGKASDFSYGGGCHVIPVLLPEFFENMKESARNKDTRAANGSVLMHRLPVRDGP
jgi:hypothetical protein